MAWRGYKPVPKENGGMKNEGLQWVNDEPGTMEYLKNNNGYKCNGVSHVIDKLEMSSQKEV